MQRRKSKMKEKEGVETKVVRVDQRGPERDMTPPQKLSISPTCPIHTSRLSFPPVQNQHPRVTSMLTNSSYPSPTYHNWHRWQVPQQHLWSPLSPVVHRLPLCHTSLPLNLSYHMGLHLKGLLMVLLPCCTSIIAYHQMLIPIIHLILLAGHRFITHLDHNRYIASP